MLHLRILGGAAVLSSDGALTGAAARRRALALLALIASARDEGLPRDRALAMLWPELDSDRARNNLKQLVFSLRRALSPEVFAASGAALRLDPNVITVDVWAYEKAISDGALESAVARYGGPFLDGFSVPGLAELERWVEAERDRLARVHAETLDTLAERARRAGDFEIAAAWRRHLAALDPLHTKYAAAFVRALADAGDVAGALRHAHLFERLVRSELDADVGPDMRLLIAQLRLRAESTAARAITSDELAILTTDTRAGTSADRSLPVPAMERVTTVSEPVPPTALPTPRPWFRRLLGSMAPRMTPWRLAIIGFAVADVLLIGFLGLSRAFGPKTALGEVPSDLPANVVIFAIDGHASTLTGELARATTELLATSLDGGTGLNAITAPSNLQPDVRTFANDSSVVDASSAARRAERLGARLFVLGRIVEVAGHLRVTASLHDASRADQPLTRAKAEGSANDMFGVVDRVASQLLAGRFPGSRGDLAREMALTSTSLPAAKAYFAAEQQLGTGRFSAAVDALRDAVRIDSGLALAYYRLSHAAELVGNDADARAAALAAFRASDRLDDHYRRLIAATAARLAGDVSAAERAYSRLTIDYPNDANAWLGLGETLFHLNPTRGRLATEARDAFIRAVDIDPRSVDALVHLARIEALRGDSAAVDRWLQAARQYANDDHIGRLALHVRGLGGSPAAGGVDRMRLQRATTLYRGPEPRDVLVAIDPRESERYASQFLAPDVPADLAAYGHRLAAYATAGAGRFSDAMRHLDEAGTIDVGADLDVRSLLAAIPNAPVDSATIADTRRALERWQAAADRGPDQSLDAIAQSRARAVLRLQRLALLALRVGDAGAATRTIKRLERMEPDSETRPMATALALSLRARLAALQGDSARALTLAEQVDWPANQQVASAEPLARLLHADLLLAVGRPADALRWYASIGQGSPTEQAFIGFATLGMARASEQLGDREGTQRAYARLGELWRDADAPLQALLVAASGQAAAVAEQR